MASIHSQAVPETKTRTTKEGRKLTYALRVIQQPERARACGSGAKSSADRRPVDPPPVVELRIFEGEGNKNDITFGYNANFFLFATLESARPIAQPRGQAPTPQIPVLTGMPVSGMAYLDRPSEAGYFIFPDLSVRHEGKYRLSFNLYEETKETKDADPESPEDQQSAQQSDADSPKGFTSAFNWRLKVESEPFTVYSAKKFPGLAESTALSRTVAEQGCRVRIRRDVRMRRREDKGGFGNDYEKEDANTAYNRSHRATPDAREAYRHRSLSNASADRQPYPMDQHRRGSIIDYQQQNSAPSRVFPNGPSYGPSPVASQAATQPSYLQFRSGLPPQYPTQLAQPAPAAPQGQHQFASANQSPYYAPSQAYSAAPSTRSGVPSTSYSYDRQAPPPPPTMHGSYSTAATTPRRESYEVDSRRTSAVSYRPISSPLPAVDQAFSRPPSSTAPQYHMQPPANPPNESPRRELAPLQLSKSDFDGPLANLSVQRQYAPPPFPSPRVLNQAPYFPSLAGPDESRKRTNSEAFGASSYQQPVREGRKVPSTDADEEHAAMEDDGVLEYPRANGQKEKRVFTKTGQYHLLEAAKV